MASTPVWSIIGYNRLELVSTMSKFPQVKISKRELHFFILCDCSGSMAAMGKMQSLNQSIKQSIPSMARVARQNPESQLIIRVVRFSDAASWHIETRCKIEDFEWKDLTAGGLTAMGSALELVAHELNPSAMGSRALTPIILLISDGQPTDNFSRGLEILLEQPWGKKAVKLAIAIGSDCDRQVLKRFTGDGREEGSVRVFDACNSMALSNYIEWVSTVVVSSVSLPVTRLNAHSAEGGIAHDIPNPATILANQEETDNVIW